MFAAGLPAGFNDTAYTITIGPIADADNVGDSCDNCPDDANPDQENGDGDAIPYPDISDLAYLVDYMFVGGPPPVDCPGKSWAMTSY